MRVPIVCLIFACALYVTGCATIQLHGLAETAYVKQFKPPAKGKSGLYIFREEIFGGMWKDIWVDGECLGRSAPNVFFYHEVSGDSEHAIATESEFSYNELKIKVESGRNYFIEQYTKLGIFIDGADLTLVDAETAKEIITDLDMAIKGICLQQIPH